METSDSCQPVRIPQLKFDYTGKHIHRCESPMKSNHNHFHRIFLCLIPLYLSLSACSSTPPVTNEVQAISSAALSEQPAPSAIQSIPAGYASLSNWGQNFYTVGKDWEFLLIPENNPQTVRFDADLSLNELPQGQFWGYALRHSATGRTLPLYGELRGNGTDRLTEREVQLVMQGYFSHTAFGRFEQSDSTADRLDSVGLSGFAGQRWKNGEQDAFNSHMISRRARDGRFCEFVYDFWDAGRQGSGIEFEDLSTFRFTHGHSLTLNKEPWLVYRNLPRPINLSLQAPSEKILRQLLSTHDELPLARYDRTFPYAEDHLDCKTTRVFGGQNVGNSQHEYSLFYRPLSQFGKLVDRGKSYRYRNQGGVYEFARGMYGTQRGGMGKFLALSRYEPVMDRSREGRSLNLMNLTEFSPDLLYARGPQGQLEIWQVGGAGEKQQGYVLGNPLRQRFPVHIEQLDVLTTQGYLMECADGLQLLVGSCDGAVFPTVRRSASGEQVEVWASAEDRTLFAWNPSNKKLETAALPPLSEGMEAQTYERDRFLCEQLSDNMAQVDRRLQRPFLSKRPYASWYEQHVPRFLSYVQQGQSSPRNQGPKDVANRLDYQERRGLNEISELLSQVRRAEKLANADVCPETQALASEYVPMVAELRATLIQSLNALWEPVRGQADQLSWDIFQAGRSRRKAEAEAWQRQFWANAVQDFQSKVDITQTVNQITAQTNQMYQNALRQQEAYRQARERARAQQQPAPVAERTQPRTPAPNAPVTPQKTQRPAYEGFPAQQEIRIQVPNAVALGDLEKGGTHGGTREVVIPGSGPSGNPGSASGSGSPGSSSSNQNKPSGTPPERPTKVFLESLAYCYSKVEGKWFCDGITQKTLTSDPLETSLSLVGCKSPRKWVNFEEGRLYFCDQKRLDPQAETGKITWNRDISRWRNIPQALLDQRRTFNER